MFAHTSGSHTCPLLLHLRGNACTRSALGFNWDCGEPGCVCFTLARLLYFKFAIYDVKWETNSVWGEKERIKTLVNRMRMCIPSCFNEIASFESEAIGGFKV